MDEIFDKWINIGQISITDVIPIMIEYDSLYNDGTLKAKDCEEFLQFLQIVPNFSIGQFVNKCLKQIALKRDGELIEVFDKNGKFLRRYWYKNSSENEI